MVIHTKCIKAATRILTQSAVWPSHLLVATASQIKPLATYVSMFKSGKSFLFCTIVWHHLLRSACSIARCSVARWHYSIYCAVAMWQTLLFRTIASQHLLRSGCSCFVRLYCSIYYAVCTARPLGSYDRIQHVFRSGYSRASCFVHRITAFIHIVAYQH